MDPQFVKNGCYVKNARDHEVNFFESMVPLRHIDYNLLIVNSLMNIQLKQKYWNPSSKFLQVEYSFPVHPQSSIYEFRVQFGQVSIEGRVKEKEEAKKDYEKAKREGRQAVIGTIDPRSKDIMTLEIGNIPPETEFTVFISFIQQISLAMNTFYRIQIPSTISPRYLSYADRLLKQKKQEKEKSGKPDFTWNFKIQLQTTRKVIFYHSPSHELKLLSENEAKTQLLLTFSTLAMPNKDFVFMYTTEDFHLPSYVHGKTDSTSTVMLSFIPKFCDLAINDAFQAQTEGKTMEVQIDTARGDYIFLLDRSYSMEGTRFQRAAEALILFLQSLPADSYFNVVSFGSHSNKMFKKSEKYNTESLQEAVKQIKSMSADMGGTQIFNPLKTILEEDVNKGYPKQIFLLTDGDVCNTESVLQLVKSKTNRCRVHSIGVGNGASMNLIQGAAKNGKGKYILISDHQNPAEKIIQLLESTLTPLISEMRLKFDEKNVQSIIPNPQQIPYILKDEVVSFFVTLAQPLKQAVSFTFEYEDTLTKMSYNSQIEVQPDCPSYPFVDKMSHYKVVQALEEASKGGAKVEDRMFYVKVSDPKEEAVRASIKYQVLSEYTAFLCVGRQLIDGQYQEFEGRGVTAVEIQQPKSMQYAKMAYQEEEEEEDIDMGGLFDGGGGGSFYSPPPPPRNNVLLMKEEEPDLMFDYEAPQKKLQSEEKEGEEQLFAEDFRSCDYIEPKHLEQKQQPHHSQKLTIDSVIKHQRTEGFWEEAYLLAWLEESGVNLQQYFKQYSQTLTVTYVLTKWVEKHHKQKQYKLILKKAQSWLQKNLPNGHSLNQLDQFI